MGTKFNLYDFLAYVIPGFVLLLSVVPFIVPLIPDLSMDTLKVLSFASGIFLVLACYVIGHIIQSLRSHLWRLPILLRLLKCAISPTGKLIPLIGTQYFSMSLLLEDDQNMPDDKEPKVPKDPAHRSPFFSFPVGIRKPLKEALSKRLSIGLEDPEDYQIAWELARAHLTAKGTTGHAELYNAMSNMYGNLCIVLRFFLLFALINAIVHILINFSITDWQYPSVLVAIGAALYPIGYLAALQYRTLAWQFARSIYLGYYTTECMSPGTSKSKRSARQTGTR